MAVDGEVLVGQSISWANRLGMPGVRGQWAGSHACRTALGWLMAHGRQEVQGGVLWWTLPNSPCQGPAKL